MLMNSLKFHGFNELEMAKIIGLHVSFNKSRIVWTGTIFRALNIGSWFEENIHHRHFGSGHLFKDHFQQMNLSNIF